MAAIQNDWLNALQGEFRKPYYKELFQTVKQEYHTHRIYPPSDDIFNAFHLLLGTDGHALFAIGNTAAGLVAVFR